MPGAVLRFEQHLILFYFYTVTFNDMWAFSAQGWIANVKRTFLALVVFCAVLAPLIHVVRQQVPIYEARSLISFALGREYVYVPEPSLSDIKAPNAGDFQGFVNAEILLLDNPRLIESAVDKVGFERTYPDLPFTDAGRRAATVALDAATKVELKAIGRKTIRASLGLSRTPLPVGYHAFLVFKSTPALPRSAS